MGDQDTKRLILARRARFFAAAVASISAVAQAGACNPAPCLEPPMPSPDAGTPRDAGVKDAETPGTPGTLDDSSVPQPCLSTVPPDAESK